MGRGAKHSESHIYALLPSLPPECFAPTNLFIFIEHRPNNTTHQKPRFFPNPETRFFEKTWFLNTEAIAHK
jgi:hypothetical protein